MKNVNTIVFGFISMIILGFSTFNHTLEAAPRMVLVEEFTNASCGPCAAQNPTFKGWLRQNTDKVIPIMFHPNFPGRDVMYSDNPDMHMGRFGFYANKIQSFGVPTAFVNGIRRTASSNNFYDGAPSDLNALTNAVTAVAGTESPYSIDVQSSIEGQTINTTVKVSSSAASSGKKLQIAVVEGYHYYESAGTNGEKDFYYVVRHMLPDLNGQILNLAAGEDKTFTHSQVLAIDLYKPSIYVVAFIQDDATGEILQANSSDMPNIIDLESKPKFNLAVDALDKNFRIDANSTVEKTITVNNPSSKAVDVLISRNESIALPNGWSVELVENQKNVPAGATVEFKVNVTSGSTAGLAEISFNALPINIGEDFPMTKSVRFLALSNKTKYAIFVGAHGQISAIVNAVNGLQKYASETALIPINAEILNTFSPKDFEVSIVSNNFDLYGLFGGRFNESGIIMNQILEAINSGKKVIMASDYDLTFANSQQGSQQARDFYKSIGVESAAQAVNRRQIVNNQWGGTLYNFDIKGIQNDPISNGMAFIGNQYNQTTNPFYVYWTDFIRPTSGSDGVQFLNLDNDVSKGGGLRFQKGNSRYVYLSVGFEALNPNDRRLLVERILDWVTEPTTNPGGPSISLNTNALNFGTVDTDKNKELDVVITNSGDENLNISEIAITGDDNGYFSIVSGADVTSITPGNSSTIKVRFAPTSGGNFTAALNVMSNGANEQSSTVNLSGIGNPAGSVAYGTTPNGMLSMSMTPNPVSANSRFNYTITGNGAKNVRIYVMDLAGRKVQELVNNSVEVGNHSIEFSANGFSAGTYYIMAEIDGSQAQIPVVIVK